MAMPLTKSSYSIITTPRGNGLGVFIDGRDGLLKLKDAVGVIEPIGNYLNTAAIDGYGLVSGGIVTWLGGLDFQISAAQYYINNQLYNSPTTFVTLSDADPTNPRIDSFAVNTSGQAIVLEGTPAASPQQPSIAPLTQLYLTFVRIDAGATTPANTSNLDIYKENVEWDWVNVDFNVSNPDYTQSPFEGTKSLRVCNLGTPSTPTVQRGYFWQSTEYNISDYDSVSFAFLGKLNSTSNSITIALRTGSDAVLGGAITAQIVLTNGDYGINFTNQTWQIITIPLNDFSLQPANGDTFNSLYIQNNVIEGCMQFDNILLQTGLAPPSDSFDYFEFINSDSNTMEATQAADTFSFVGAGGLATSISGKTVTIDGSGKEISVNVDNGITGDGTAANPLRLGDEFGQIDQTEDTGFINFHTGVSREDQNVGLYLNRAIGVDEFHIWSGIAGGNRAHFYIDANDNFVVKNNFASNVSNLNWTIESQRDSATRAFNITLGTSFALDLEDTGFLQIQNSAKDFSFFNSSPDQSPHSIAMFCENDGAFNGIAFRTEDNNDIILTSRNAYGVPTGTLTRGGIDTASATQADVNEVLAALIVDLQEIGLLRTI